MSLHFLILGGDLNCLLNPDLDCSSTSSSGRAIRTFMDEFAIWDVWRFFNPSNKVFTFFSYVHHTFTRIDYFLVDNKFLPSASFCSYEAIVVSDHSPVTMNVQFKGRIHAQTPCRLNTHLLSDENFLECISNQIHIFLSINKTPDISLSVLWETLKAHIRGQIIFRK